MHGLDAPHSRLYLLLLYLTHKDVWWFYFLKQVNCFRINVPKKGMVRPAVIILFNGFRAHNSYLYRSTLWTIVKVFRVGSLLAGHLQKPSDQNMYYSLKRRNIDGRWLESRIFCLLKFERLISKAFGLIWSHLFLALFSARASTSKGSGFTGALNSHGYRTVEVSGS